MNANGGYATLGFLYQNVAVSDWGTKTPFKTINRIVQDNRFFFKIKPGLWALKDRKEEVLKKFNIAKRDVNAQAIFNHSYFQGLLVEVGNEKGFQTFVPNQDKNKTFLDKSLKDLTTIPDIYPFTYEKIIQRAKTVDVIWFNDRKMPSSFFEVEHSTDIYNSLIKFSELQDFYSNFCIVSDIVRRREFVAKIDAAVFTALKSRVSFLSYDQLSELHSTTFKLKKAEENLDFLRK